MKEFIIGRNGNQPFPITADGVSGQHARITIDDNGVWTLEDLKGDSGNGVFLRDEFGIFHRVYKLQISEQSIIRLAQGGYHSYTFMAHRVLITRPNDLSYEFQYYKQLADEWKMKEASCEKQNETHAVMARWIPILGIFLSFLPFISTQPILLRIFTVLPAMLTGFIFRKDPQKLKNIRIARHDTVVCPNCGRPLSDFDVENMTCSVCKAR